MQIGNFDIDDAYYQKMLKKLTSFFGNPGRATETLERHLDNVKRLYENGGILYRLMFLESKEKINKNKLGRHWVADEYVLDDIRNSLLNAVRSEKDPDYEYIITIKIPPKNVDVENSISQFIENPTEEEMWLNSTKQAKIEDIQKNPIAETIIRRRFAKLTESYAAIVSLPDVDVKEYAKAAIRDIFIQMPSRSVTLENWDGFKNYVVGFFGKNSYNVAMEELQKEGWLTKGETRYEWVKMYGPVGTVPKLIYLNEWADSIKTDKLELDYKDEGAYPFVYDIKRYEVVIGKHMMTHPASIPATRIGDKKSDHIIQGRIWVSDKIISLWEYPDTKSMYKALIDKLNEEMEKRNITPKIDFSWKIDIPNAAVDFLNSTWRDAVQSVKDSEDAKLFRDVQSYLIPIFDWTPNMMKNPKKYKKELDTQREKHMMSPIAKYSNSSDNIGSKKRPANLTTTQRHQMKSTSENKINEIQTEYGCLMLAIHIPWWKDFVETYIKDEDIYNNAKQEYGREYESHVTILYGFTENVDVEKMKSILYTLKRPISVKITGVNIFKTNQYDVVKFDIQSRMLEKLNEVMTENFDYVKLHNKYSPHMTISYVKPGSGDKYVRKLKNAILLTSADFMYSYPGGKKETFNILKSSTKMI